ncbi:drug resistance transporter, EmrB/QacA subfamily [Streptomyces sp. DvalAA-14]|uniref:MFS transporter n=1 Tax=unclassified Streptomyces TaxID=2593676 RepID=UPI00081B04FB|nr:MULTISPECIES: MFS transporter [unclassified Streptomyces]MYS23001.1 MFS transporter [Streptomyces sp. SID4948]SCE25793.1 drug resistance transporter, EmrB/QacA subfamily [Streptomyces sp. DvalAA-14]
MVETGNRKPVRPVPKVAVLATIFVAVFVSNVDLFVVNVALPDIGRDLSGASLGALSWVLNAYAIVFAALLVVAGRLADRHGQRTGFQLGLALFTAGSAMCAVAGGVGWLVAARCIQAVGAAALLPTSLALMLEVTAPARRAGMVRAWSAVGGVAAALGPVLGGVLVQASWRWVFIINVPIGVVALVVGARVLPKVASDRSGAGPDLAGAALVTLSIGALSLGLVKSNEWGWGDPRTLGSFAVALLLLAGFLAQSRRHPAPIVEMAILRNSRFSTASASMLLFTLAFAGVTLSSALWCQDVWHYSALRTGLALAPGPLMVPALAVVSGPLAKRFGPGPVSAVGNVLFGAGILWWPLAVGSTPHYASAMLPGFLIGGVGVGLCLPTLTAAGATALPPQRLATGAGVITMARQIGAVLGVAVLVGVLGTPHSLRGAVHAYRDGWYVLAGVSVLAGLVALGVRRPPRADPATGPVLPEPDAAARVSPGIG